MLIFDANKMSINGKDVEGLKLFRLSLTSFLSSQQF